MFLLLGAMPQLEGLSRCAARIDYPEQHYILGQPMGPYPPGPPATTFPGTPSPLLFLHNYLLIIHYLAIPPHLHRSRGGFAAIYKATGSCNNV
ncbi:hypothetical protein RHGRI_029304 [Rhododendron griersonianum]|uniref:Uncharacterized protein n=1 Tax=Rhododendron griersonianum TaxID=479676 RepID=A0AAV6IPL6_9ERIC|nr:hypothetical protein RHGRI_029304 [Rhododendron griersonianum]